MEILNYSKVSSYRISIEFIVDDKTIIPVNIGTHDEVYKN